MHNPCCTRLSGLENGGNQGAKADTLSANTPCRSAEKTEAMARCHLAYQQ
jgi:hypothetical protein